MLRPPVSGIGHLRKEGNDGSAVQIPSRREIVAFKKKVQGAGLFLGRSSGYRRGPSPEQGDYPHW
jgi:hypothetical protein